MSNKIKELRGQLRQIVKEILPELLSDAVFQSIESRLRNEMNARLNKIDERQEAIQGFVVRQSKSPIAPKQD